MLPVFLSTEIDHPSCILPFHWHRISLLLCHRWYWAISIYLKQRNVLVHSILASFPFLSIFRWIWHGIIFLCLLLWFILDSIQAYKIGAVFVTSTGILLYQGSWIASWKFLLYVWLIQLFCFALYWGNQCSSDILSCSSFNGSSIAFRVLFLDSTDS